MLELHTNHNQPFSLIVCFDSQEIDIASTVSLRLLVGYRITQLKYKIIKYLSTGVPVLSNVRMYAKILMLVFFGAHSMAIIHISLAERERETRLPFPTAEQQVLPVIAE